MGYWNIGMLEYWVWRNEVNSYMDDTDQKLKSGYHPPLLPHIPLFHRLYNGKHHPSGVQSKPGPLGPDLYFLLAGWLMLCYKTLFVTPFPGETESPHLNS